MNIEKVLTGEKDEKLFLLGNEATVRGALESGVQVAATYPGTPSSEIGDVFSKIAKQAGVYFEFSINEKVAMEVAAAASASGLRSFTFMKHVGLNVASDSFMSLVYTGVNGGMVVLSADDPSMFSSQNEQDNRNYARLANLPMLEPSNPQEIKDLMKYGFELSEKFKLPVMIRTTTRVSHMRGMVKFDTVNRKKEKGFFHRDPERFVPVPETARIMHKELVEKMEKIKDKSENSVYNKIYNNDADIGIITSGSAFNYVMDILDQHKIKANVLKVTFSYPFPEKLVLKFLKSVKDIVVVEEVDPVMEKEVLTILGKYGIKRNVHGKLDGTLPMIYEYSPDIIVNSFNKIYEPKIPRNKVFKSKVRVPKRPPTLCPGCPHRAVYYNIKTVLDDLNIKDPIYPTDIGCYTLGIEAPYESADYLLSMGSSIGTSCGFSKATNQVVISFIGDSTFFHAGIPPLINAVHNKNNFLLVILDNRTTAMTGGQPHPGLPVDGMGDAAPEISIEKIVKATGVQNIKTINPLNIRTSREIFKEALEYQGVSVVISKYPCMLIKNQFKKKQIKLEVKENKCRECLYCLENLACPAIFLSDNGSVKIDGLQCKGCTVCKQICPEQVIKVRK
ncbi:MAG: indolepyruvate ferredoxin oxidoreductase subunit alpha [Methanobacteriaceae archaeon]|nr:indolepyruvate ferredoxin oxidoreductase subunit alpha [Methanobacteriaceae archaeon]